MALPSIFSNLSLTALLAKFFLSFSNELMAVIILGGFCTKYWLKFIHASLLLLSSIIINCTLKQIFKIPTNPSVHIPGYAFPSGHMQASIVFYLYFIIFYKNILLRGSLILLVLGIAFSLIYLGYHNYRDIMGAMLAGVICLTIFIYGEKNWQTTQLSLITFGLSSILMAILYFIDGLKINGVLAYGGLLILTPFIFFFYKL